MLTTSLHIWLSRNTNKEHVSWSGNIAPGANAVFLAKCQNCQDVVTVITLLYLDTYRMTSLTLPFIQGHRVCIDLSSDKHFFPANCCAKPIRRPIKPHNHNQRLNGREISCNLQSPPQISTSNDSRLGASLAVAWNSLMRLKAQRAPEPINQFNIKKANKAFRQSLETPDIWWAAWSDIWDLFGTFRNVQ